MSLIPEFASRSHFDWDSWFRPLHLDRHFGPSTLDLFDPFDDLDTLFSRNLTWLQRPDFAPLLSRWPFVPQKYRVTVDVAGFRADSIKTDVQNGKVIVTAKEEERQASDSQDYVRKELRKTYELPPNAEADKLASFVTRGGKLVIEVPLKPDERQQGRGGHSRLNDLFPRVSEDNKSVSVSVSLPGHVDPSKVSVTVKDRDLIVKAEDRTEDKDGVSSYAFYQRRTLPELTDLDAVRCTMDGHKLTVHAPLHQSDYVGNARHIPIERESSGGGKNRRNF